MDSRIKTIIYGTGDYGKKVFSLLQIENQNVCFCKTDAQKNEFCEGISVICADSLDQYIQEDVRIIIAIKNSLAVSDIRKMLLKKGFLRQQILDVRSFFSDNVIANQDKGTEKKDKLCNVCGNRIGRYMPAGERSELFSDHYVIGGGYREHAVCPVCGALDRDRWQHYVIEYETDILKSRCRVLHIAPEAACYRFIRENPYCDYYTGDIEIGSAMHQIDLTDIQFCNNFFDYVIANHVFEHISDEQKMFEEIRRVLKPEGAVICSFPICMDMDTLEKKEELSAEERLRYYGQKDHVRLYGRDFKEHIEQFGFDIKVISPRDRFQADNIEKYGFICDDKILICKSRV